VSREAKVNKKPHTRRVYGGGTRISPLNRGCESPWLHPYAGITQIRLNGRRQISRPLSLAFPKLPLICSCSLRR